MLIRMAVVTSVLTLAVGCAGGEPVPSGSGQAGGSVGQSTSAAPSSKSQDVPKTIISARISQGKVEGVPAEVQVDRGTPVRIEVTSDRNDELHVHGYDKTVPLVAGSPATVDFVADVPGVFEVETHDSDLLLFQLVVRE